VKGEGVRLSRRKFLEVSAFAVASSSFVKASEKTLPSVPDFRLGGRALVVKPILTYSVYRRLEATSWRAWGGIETESEADKEIARIRDEQRMNLRPM
jgi:hypothetical protein